MKKLEDLTKDFWTATGICLSMATLSHVTTYQLLSSAGYKEENPITRWFIQQYGLGEGLRLHFITGTAIIVGWNYLLTRMKDRGKLERGLLYVPALLETYMAMNDLYLYLNNYWNLN